MTLRRCQACGLEEGADEEGNNSLLPAGGDSGSSRYLHSKQCKRDYEEAEAIVKKRVFELVCEGTLMRSKNDDADNSGNNNTQAGREAVAKAVFDSVNRNYSEATRFYHTLMHVADLLTMSAAATATGERASSHTLTDRETVDWAILYHDIIYVATSGSNEEASARMFRECAATWRKSADCGCCMSPEGVDKVSNYILASKTHSVFDSEDEDLKYFIDSDMSVLGREDSGAYLRYCRQVRLEYGHLSDAEWAAGRERFLRSVLFGERRLCPIYATEDMQRRLDGNARRNMQLELDQLLLLLPLSMQQEAGKGKEGRE